MGFDIDALGQASSLRVFIDYDLPEGAWGRWLGRIFGAWFARWCVKQMVNDAVEHFAARATGSNRTVQQSRVDNQRS